MLFFGKDGCKFLLKITTTPNNELMIIQGMEDDRNAQSQVDQNVTSSNLVTKSWEEAISFYGEVPAIPSWIPSGFSIQSYHVDALEAYRTFIVLYTVTAVTI